MKKSLLTLLLFFFTGAAFSEEIFPEILGPHSAQRGNLVVFETSEPADWCLAPLDKSVGKWSVDTSGKILFFASSEPGIYTICAAIVVDGQPKILSKTFANGGDEEDFEPQPDLKLDLKPDPDDFEAWIRANTAELSLTKNYLAEKKMFAACFQSVVDGIRQGSVRSAAAARAGLRTCLASKLLTCSAESRKLWTQFLDLLAKEIENRCKTDPNNLQLMKSVYSEVAAQIGNRK